MAGSVSPQTHALAGSSVCRPVYEHAHSGSEEYNISKEEESVEIRASLRMTFELLSINIKRVQLYKDWWKQLHIFLSASEGAGPGEGTKDRGWNKMRLLRLSLLFIFQLFGPHSLTKGCDQAQGDLLHRCGEGRL